ncbi:MAG: DNA replication/repair protein RecF [Armatimonadota bacterium]
MQVNRVRLTNFRCFADLDLELGRGLVVLIGSNASGKTSLIEAVFVASAGRSPRTLRDEELVRWGERRALVNAEFCQGDGRLVNVHVGLELASGGPRKLVTVDDKPVRRLTGLIGRLPVVLFTPADLQLTQAEPAVRRRFMNLALARLRPAYADDMARYRRALKQRNRLLQDEAPDSQIQPWTDQLIRSGSQVACHRRWLAEALDDVAAQVHSELAGPSESLKVHYAGDLASAAEPQEAAELYLCLLAERRGEERRLRRTMVGPHRDDLQLLINDRRLRRFGSQGQQRTAALSLKLGEAELMRRHGRESPLLLLDDCLSELDEARAAQVLRLTATYEQLIVTVASREPALAEARVRAWVHLVDGEVKQVERA